MTKEREESHTGYDPPRIEKSLLEQPRLVMSHVLDILPVFLALLFGFF